MPDVDHFALLRLGFHAGDDESRRFGKDHAAEFELGAELNGAADRAVGPGDVVGGKREEELAGVLAALVAAPVTVAQFRELQTDLEDAFMTLATQAQDDDAASPAVTGVR